MRTCEYLKNDSYIDNMIGKNDETIILVRAIFCAISFSCCFFLIIVYLILCLQKKLNICTKKDEDNESSSLIENEESSSKGKNNKNKINKKGKIGLGSNFMFLLTISNFFGSIFEFLFYFYYKNEMREIFDDEKYKNCTNIVEENQFIYDYIDNESECHFFGFAHNFFDLFAVCWTTMLTLLFYRSTNLSNEMLYKDTKYLIIGFIFSGALCLIFCVIPISSGIYGFSRFYCSFKYSNEEPFNIFWRYSFVGITFLNNLFNVICLFKTNRFYSKKLDIIKKQNKAEYKRMIIYVWVFRIFPIVLVISRIFKGFSRIMVEYFSVDETFEDIIEYMNAFLFASNGIFDSIACLFFFRGVFLCCWPDSISDSISEEDKECADMNYFGSEITDD